ncbi:MAG: bifunctional demethylmenaquinone methyltransferase/2-methoxy-6-polyprenyl-1,4-benzoquinol methylase UbiE [Bacteroidales bacterium]|jgi:demethylmenaquinone methyltransferase/2-methoxy-6-polyprenyl-1,4-benzoquinol methylase|nr:bifunctional demethylmenaquinone methyltransferase/2-methoxy-6-polyprenyl-1,4-benzoquinol methylase UbiE [Bacteroidales bacterium]
MADKEDVRDLFDDIAPNYDKLNHLLSFNIDKTWRKKAIKQLDKHTKKVLDVACGTGDLAIAAVKRGISEVYGIDISEKMLEIGKEKIIKSGWQEKIHLQKGDSENISFDDNIFDAVTVAFGVRNFEHLETGLKEMNRVLKKEGKVVILEFSTPSTFPMKQLYAFYFKHILPVIGGTVSKNKQAYQYLPDSVAHFPQGKDFLQIMHRCGYNNTSMKSLTFGIARIYTGFK